MLIDLTFTNLRTIGRYRINVYYNKSKTKLLPKMNHDAATYDSDLTSRLMVALYPYESKYVCTRPQIN